MTSLEIQDFQFLAERTALPLIEVEESPIDAARHRLADIAEETAGQVFARSVFSS